MLHFLLSLALLLPSVAMPQRSDALLRIAVVGDVGQGTEKVAAGIAIVQARTPLDAIVLTGDNFYPCSVTSPDDPRWSIVRPLSALNLPLYPVFGNHDYCPSGYRKVQLNAPLPHWIFPASQYTATSKLADFLFLLQHRSRTVRTPSRCRGRSGRGFLPAGAGGGSPSAITSSSRRANGKPLSRSLTFLKLAE